MTSSADCFDQRSAAIPLRQRVFVYVGVHPLDFTRAWSPGCGVDRRHHPSQLAVPGHPTRVASWLRSALSATPCQIRPFGLLFQVERHPAAGGTTCRGSPPPSTRCQGSMASTRRRSAPAASFMSASSTWSRRSSPVPPPEFAVLRVGELRIREHISRDFVTAIAFDDAVDSQGSPLLCWCEIRTSRPCLPAPRARGRRSSSRRPLRSPRAGSPVSRRPRCRASEVPRRSRNPTELR